MTDIVIYKDETGKLAGLGEKGRRAYNKFCKLVRALEIGETLRFSYQLPRSPQHHRFFFWRLTVLFERQERFDDLKRFLDYLKVGAGHVDFFPCGDGVLVAMPKSIAWHLLEEQDFIEFSRAMNDFLWTPDAQAAIWPQLGVHQRYAMVDQWHREVQ